MLGNIRFTLMQAQKTCRHTKQTQNGLLGRKSSELSTGGDSGDCWATENTYTIHTPAAMFKGFTVTQFQTPEMAHAAFFGQEETERPIIKKETYH